MQFVIRLLKAYAVHSRDVNSFHIQNNSVDINVKYNINGPFTMYFYLNNCLLILSFPFPRGRIHQKK